VRAIVEEIEERLRKAGARPVRRKGGDHQAASAWCSAPVQSIRPEGCCQGGLVREYGMPASAKIPASAGLDDVVFRRAQAEPGAVMLRRRAPWGGWQDMTAGQFRAEVTALARRIIG
jgi:hypothetical protein